MSSELTFERQLEGILDQIDQSRRKGLTQFAGLGAAIVGTIALLTVLGAQQLSAIILLIGGLFGGASTLGRAKRSQKILVMPLLAEQLGLAWESLGEQVADHLPPLIVPVQKPVSEDRVSGTLAGRKFSFTDLRIHESRGDNDKIFKGFVLTLQMSGPKAEFALVAEDLSQKWLRSGLTAQGMKIAGTINASHHRVYHLWTPDGSKVPDVDTTTALIDLEDQFGPGSRLWSLRLGDGEFSIVVRQSDRFLRIGGLFQSREGLRADMKIALAKLAQPLKIASAILELEPRLLPKPAPEKSSPDT